MGACCNDDLSFSSIYSFSSSQDLRFSKHVHDNVHGSIYLDPLFLKFIDTEQFQRLRDLKQLVLTSQVSTKKLKVAECEQLVEKMTARIKRWSSKNLSYAGRLLLVNSVLMSLQVYWAQIFIIPGSILQKIKSICRAYLWHGTYDSSKAGHVKWEEVCLDKKGGGLDTWNMAAVGKMVWTIGQKQDILWVKWVHSIYLKNKHWTTYKAPSTASWVWKMICQIKDHFHTHCPQVLTHNKYNISEVYNILRPSTHPVQWCKGVWNRYSVPKHRFIMWLAQKERLQVRSRLYKHGICPNAMCVICGAAEETQKHLLEECTFTCKCVRALKNWLGIRTPKMGLADLSKWTTRSYKGSAFRKKVLHTCWTAAVYYVWQARNKKIWEESISNEDCIVDKIKYDVKHRVMSIVSMKIKNQDIAWMYSL